MCASPVAIGKMLPVIHDINTTMYSQYISNNASSASEWLQSIWKPDKHPHVDDHCIHSSAVMIRDVRVFSPPPPWLSGSRSPGKKKKKGTNKQTSKNIFQFQKNAKCSVLQRTQGRQLPLLLQSYKLTIILLGLAFPFLPYTRTHRQQRRVSKLHCLRNGEHDETGDDDDLVWSAN